MSAPPSKKPNGPPKSKPNPLRPMRPKPRANPLVAPKAPGQKPPSKPTPAKPSTSNAQQNGSRQSLEELRKKHGGWSEPPPPYKFSDIPIMTTRKALLDGIRYHLMRLNSTKDGKSIDPTDQEEFARPVTLQRRDARLPPAGRAIKEQAPERPPLDELERERLAQIKAEKEAQRAINQAKIAPVIKEVAPKKPKKQKEERTVFNRAPRTAAAKKEADLRYEEALPWHLEDVDGKNVWAGSYVAALSESNVAFMIDQSVFRMVPIEKWYRFTAKPHFQAFTIDQAEEYMNRKMEVGRWVMKDEERKSGQKDLEATRRMLYGSGQMIKTESDTFKAASRAEKMEHDEIDMSGDEFQDDDEAPTFERNDDEDTKDSKDRIRREQLGANLFGEGDEGQVDQELKQELKEELERQKYGKATRKALIKRDREDIYESDKSEDNPWSSSSDGDSSDEETEEQNEEEKKDGENKDEKDDKTKLKALIPQNSTASQGKQKHNDKKNKSLKRAGSPALSESSVDDPSRKKAKKPKTTATTSGSRSGTPIPGASRKNKLGAGSTSDGEVTAGEMSDGAGPRKKIKLAESARGTPLTSRAGSPTPAGTGGSPAPGGPLSPAPSGLSGGIEPWEILEKIPPEGVSIGELIKPFQSRVGAKPGQMDKKDWIKLVTQLCDYGPDKLLRKRK